MAFPGGAAPWREGRRLRTDSVTSGGTTCVRSFRRPSNPAGPHRHVRAVHPRRLEPAGTKTGGPLQHPVARTGAAGTVSPGSPRALRAPARAKIRPIIAARFPLARPDGRRRCSGRAASSARSCSRRDPASNGGIGRGNGSRPGGDRQRQGGADALVEGQPGAPGLHAAHARVPANRDGKGDLALVLRAGRAGVDGLLG